MTPLMEDRATCRMGLWTGDGIFAGLDSRSGRDRSPWPRQGALLTYEKRHLPPPITRQIEGSDRSVLSTLQRPHHPQLESAGFRLAGWNRDGCNHETLSLPRDAEPGRAVFGAKAV